MHYFGLEIVREMLLVNWLFCYSSQGDWIVADKDPDAKHGGKVLVFMYKVKCENSGISKDSLLTETSDFAILVGQELQDEVRCRFSFLAQIRN